MVNRIEKWTSEIFLDQELEYYKYEDTSWLHLENLNLKEWPEILKKGNGSSIFIEKIICSGNQLKSLPAMPDGLGLFCND